MRDKRSVHRRYTPTVPETLISYAVVSCRGARRCTVPVGAPTPRPWDAVAGLHRCTAGSQRVPSGRLRAPVRRGRVALRPGFLPVQALRRHGAAAVALCHARVRGGWVLPELGSVAGRGGDGGPGGVVRGSSVGPRARVSRSRGWLRREERSAVGAAHQPTEVVLFQRGAPKRILPPRRRRS